MIALLTGGCKQGKSSHAERLALSWAAGGRAVYLATMRPTDQEDLDRIARHVASRHGKGFVTCERADHIADAPVEATDTVLLDSGTALLANEMFTHTMDEGAAQRVASDLLFLSKRCRNLVVVSDGIYSDSRIYDPWTEAFRQGLALIDRTLAAHGDLVAEAHAGCLYCYKGRDFL